MFRVWGDQKDFKCQMAAWYNKNWSLRKRIFREDVNVKEINYIAVTWSLTKHKDCKLQKQITAFQPNVVRNLHAPNSIKSHNFTMSPFIRPAVNDYKNTKMVLNVKNLLFDSWKRPRPIFSNSSDLPVAFRLLSWS